MAMFFATGGAAVRHAVNHHNEERYLPEDVESYFSGKLKKRREKGTDVAEEGTPQHIYLKWIRDEIERESACLELPFTILILAAFALLSLSYMAQPQLKTIEEAIVTDIAENANFAWAHNFGHKSIGDVNSYADFWSWSRLGFMPLIVPSGPWSYSEGLDEAVPAAPGLPAYDSGALPTRRPFPGYRRPTPVKNDYLRYNRIIGGLRFRQQHAEASDDNCVFSGETATFKAYIGKECTENTNAELPPDLFATETMVEPTAEEWFLSDMEPHEILIQRLIDMEDGCTSAKAQNRTCLCKWCAQQRSGHPWLNELTKRIEISFIVFNAQYGIYSMATVNFWFNRAGHIHKRINVRSSWAGLSVRDTGSLIIFLVSGFVWLFSNIYLFRSEGREITDQIRKKAKPWYLTLVEDYLSFWNIVDWVSIIIASFIVGLFLHLQWTIGYSSDALGAIVQDMLTGRTSVDVEYMELIRSFYSNVETMARQERYFRFWLCAYPLVLMMRLFKSFAAQPRLAVVTETFKEALTDMVHFFLVFSSVYFCMSINAVLFFGQDDVNFSRLDWALFSCWRVMLTDWDWDGMSKIGRFKAFIWLFIFMLIMVLILLNILVSILMDAYASAKSTAENADSMFTQIILMLRRYRETRDKKRVRLGDIEAWLIQDADNDETAAFANKRMLFPMFRVQLDRTSGDAIGLNLKHTETNLLILEVRDGAAKKWNLANPIMELRCGDEIVDVDGVRGDPVELEEALKQPKKLVLRLRRRKNNPEYLEILQRQAEDRFHHPTPHDSMRGTFEPVKSNDGKEKHHDGKAHHKRKGSKEKLLGGESKRPPREVAFLLDMVGGIQEKQAKRTLGNSRDEHWRVHGEAFSTDKLEEPLNNLLERVSASTMCAGWVKYKLTESAEKVSADKDAANLEEELGDMHTCMSEAASAHHHVKKQQEAEQQDAIENVRAVAEARTSDLADDIAAVLGEEMHGLERRQKDMQRAMRHTQDSLKGLRQMVYKLNMTCEDLGTLAGSLTKDGGSRRELIRAPSAGRRGSSDGLGEGRYNAEGNWQAPTLGEDAVAARAELQARSKAQKDRRPQNNEDDPLNNYKFSKAVGGRKV